VKTDVAIILASYGNEVEATAMVRDLIEDRLIACGNILPGMRSIYCWEGEVQEEEEVLVMLKTTDSMSSSVVSRIVDDHSYDTPEVIKLAVEDGYEPYLTWVRGATMGEIG